MDASLNGTYDFCQIVYRKTSFELKPEDGFIKKSRNMSLI